MPPGGLTLVTIIAKAPTWQQQHWCPDCWNFTLRTCEYHMLQPGQHGFIHRGHYIVWASTPLTSALVYNRKIHLKITINYIITVHRCNRSTKIYTLFWQAYMVAWTIIMWSIKNTQTNKNEKKKPRSKLKCAASWAHMTGIIPGNTLFSKEEMTGKSHRSSVHMQS